MSPLNRTQTLQILLGDYVTLPDSAHDMVVSDIYLDSRQVVSGSIFCALGGGEQYIERAYASGASVVITTAGTGNAECTWQDQAKTKLLIALPELATHIADIASRFFDHPSQKLWLVGVTGTNGKTSCADLLVQAWRCLGFPAASIGTLGWSTSAGVYHSTGMTTTDIVENNRLLAQFVDQGIQCVAMEVSSHGIAQGRVDKLVFDVSMLTNITRDHLDYHGDMENYAAVKASFIRRQGARVVINIDDVYGAKVAQTLPEASVLYSCSLANDSAAIHVDAPIFNSSGISVSILGHIGRAQMALSLMGQFNLYNVLMVIAALRHQNISMSNIEQIAPQLKPVNGRIDRVLANKNVFVDYAHTPDALSKVLQALRQHCDGKLIVVFGCGGDRDSGKRPQMGEAASTEADVLVITTDNPRSEDPHMILAQIQRGVSTSKPVYIEVDRVAAIRKAIDMADANSIVLIAGKGHENYQEVNGIKHPYSDYDEVVRLFA